MSETRCLCAPVRGIVLVLLALQPPLLVVAQSEWSGLVNRLSQTLDFTCPNNSVLTGIASDFGRSIFDREWEFLCGTAGGVASTNTSCSLQPAINALQGDISFSCPEGGYLAGFRSQFHQANYDRVWEPYCCTRPASALINCQTPTVTFENVLRGNLNFTASIDRIITGAESFYFNRDRRWRYETCEIEVSCGDPGVPTNGRRLGNSFLYQDMVTFECEDGYYQFSGPVGGVRECLITGEWSDTQPVCSQCEVIEFCEQVLCSNGSDHTCQTCQSNRGPLPDEMAYTNLGTQCQARCSWLGTFCYPGVCPNTPQSCDCVDGFQGPNCLQISSVPSLLSCSLQLESADGATFSTPCLPSNQTEQLFTNINPHTLRGEWEGLYMGPMTPPPRPAYLPGFQVGVAVSEMVASLYRAANPSDIVSESTHECDQAPPSSDQPALGVTSCMASATPTSLSNHTFLHGDTLEVSVLLGAGGFLQVRSLDTNITATHHYTGTPAVEGAIFVLDFQPPFHCSLAAVGCPVTDPPLLSLNGEIVRSGNLSVSWGGWLDQPARVQGYTFSLYRLEEFEGRLSETGMVDTVLYNETGVERYEEMLLLPAEGAYSVLLQALDNAGNIRHARRLLLFDATSTLNLDPLAPLMVTSAVAGTMWQNSTRAPIVVSGRGHFFNSHLVSHDLLAPVSNSFNVTPPYDHPLDQGRYPRGGTPNALGVVELRYDVIIDQVGGASEESLSVPEVFEFESEDISLGSVNISTALSDGDSVRVWFLAVDYNFRQANDSVLVHVDSSAPEMSGLGLVRYGLGGLRLLGEERLTDLRVEFDTWDRHSGLLSIQWEIGTRMGLADVGAGNVPVQVMPSENCSEPECICNSVGNCSSVHYIFSPTPFDLLVSPVAHHDTEYHITITTTNHALLSSQLSLVFTVDATPPLPGAVFDGPADRGGDTDYTSGHILQGWWAGFFDRETDVQFYQYVFETECANSSHFTYPLQTDSVVMETDTNSATMQASAADTYYLTVVAWNSALTPSQPVCSDGLTVDLLPPVFGGVVIPGAVVAGGLARDAEGVVWWVGPDRTREMVREGQESPECIAIATPFPDVDVTSYPVKMLGSSLSTVSSDVCQTGHALSPSSLMLLPQDHTLNVTWQAYDNVGMREFYVAASNSSGLGEVLTSDFEPTAGQYHYSLTSPELLTQGGVVYITLRAEDLALHTSTVTLGPILVDLTPAQVNGSLQVWEGQGHVIVTWEEGSFVEEEEGAGPLLLQYAIGTTSYSDDTVSFRPLPPATPTICPHSRCIATDLMPETTPLTSGKSYVFTISVTNQAGLSAYLTSEPYYYASIAPSSGLVLDFDPLAVLDVVNGSSYHLSDVDILLEGSVLGVRWYGFSHPSASVNYSVALGLAPGADDIVPLISVGGGVSSYVFLDAPLQPGSTHFATVTAQTGFSSASASSNGVLVYGGGVASLSQASVYDGVSDVDVDYHAPTSSVSAHWYFPAHLHAVISHYMWAVFAEEGNMDGASGSAEIGPTPEEPVVVREYVNVGKGISAVGAVSGGLRAGLRYRSAVRACLATVCLPAVYSDGFYLSVTPVAGSINATYHPLEYDELYATSTLGRLELEWAEFADPQLVQYEWSIGEEEGGALRLPWRQVEWFEREVSVLVNVSLSLHSSNVVSLRGQNSAGLCTTTSTQLLWSVGDTALPQALVPRPSLVVYDIVQERVTFDPSLESWRELTHREVSMQDIEYTSSPASLSGAWPDLRYTQYSYSVSRRQMYTSCDSHMTVGCGVTFHNSATLDQLPLLDGGRYYFCVRALAQDAIHRTSATPPVLEACSNGVTVDLSPPRGECVKITCPLEGGFGHMTGSGVGGNVGELAPDWDRNCAAVNDSEFQVSTSDLYLVWEEFVDVEEAGFAVHTSGVTEYSYAIGTSPLSSDTANFSSVGVATYAAVRGVSLQPGVTYYATVRATDFTGRSGYAVSRGVRIDTSEPILKGVRIAGITSFQSSLQLEWNLVTDDESDVTSLEWSLGTRFGSSDITGWRLAGMEQNTGLLINTTQLALYEGQTIFASLKATNGAGLVGVVSSLAYTLDSSPPEVGVVYDGQPPSEGVWDQDYWRDEREVAGHWEGFADPHSGLAQYWWAVGTCPDCTDVQPFLSVGLRQAATFQVTTPLAVGRRYYVQVRACNPLGLCSQAASDGAILDLTPPTRGRVLDGLVGEELQFQPSPSLVSGRWEGFQDSQSLISSYIYYVGLAPNTSNLVPPTQVPAGHTSFLHPLATPLPSGSKVYSTVVAYNRAGLYSSTSSNGVTVDSAAPLLVSQPLIDTQWVGSGFNDSQSSGSGLRVAWNFTDNLDSVYQYFVSVMSDAGSRLGSAPQALLTSNSLSLLSPFLSLADGKTYHVLVRACDLAGLCSSAPSPLPVLVDSSPPIDGYFAVGSDSVANITPSRTIPGGMTWRNRPVRGVAQLNLAFLGFSDPHSAIAEYWATVGSSFSGWDLLPPTLLTPAVAANETVEVLLAQVTLTRQVNVSETLYISLWAVNGVGLRSHVVQASFVVEEGERDNNGSLTLIRAPCQLQSCLGHCTCATRGGLCDMSLPMPCPPSLSLASLPTNQMLRVFDVVPQLGREATPTGPLFTSLTDQLLGRWELEDPTSQEIQRLEWAVGIRDDPQGPGAGLVDVTDGIVWQNAGPAMSAVFSVSEDYPLLQGEAYVFYVRAWYGLQDYAIFRSEGVTVDYRGPEVITGRRVREGAQGARDLDFSSAPSTLEVSWDGVLSAELSGNYSDLELGVGTWPGADDTYPLTPLLQGQMTASLSGLPLEEGVAYYAILRATNELGVSHTSISDGVVVDFSPSDVGVMAGGRVFLSQAETDSFSVRWYGFNDAESGIHHYEVAVTNTSAPPPPSLYQDVGIAVATRLTPALTPGETYYAHVVAVNGAGLRSQATVNGGVIIQPARPEGRVCVGEGSQVLTNPSFENDTESGVPCPPTPLSVATATHGWDLDTSFVQVLTYSQTTPPHGCSALSFIGSISQSVDSQVTLTAGSSYLLSFWFRYEALPHRAGVRVQVPSSGVDTLVSRSSDTSGWSRAQVQFTAAATPDSQTRIILSSALSQSPVQIDRVTVSGCGQYQSMPSTNLSVTWPAAIQLNRQVISSSKVILSAMWGVVDPLSGMEGYWWAVGTTPGGEQLQKYVPTGPLPRAISEELSVTHRQDVHVTVLALSRTGRRLLVHSGPLLVDLTPPVSEGDGTGAVSDGLGQVDIDYQSSLVVSVNWSSLWDRESGLEQCSWAIGTSPGSTDVQQYLPVAGLTPDNTTASANLTLEHGTRVYSTVVCSNKGGLLSRATSDGLTVLYQPPSNDNAFISTSSSAYTLFPPQQGYLPTTAATLHWDGFAESAGTPLEYEVRVLEGGVTGQANWTSVSSAKMLTLHDLELPENTSHTIEIRAVNLGGVVSEPVRTNIAIISTSPEDTGIAFNVSWSDDSVLTVDWAGRFSSPAPLYFEFSLGTQKGSGSVRKWVELSTVETGYSVSSMLLQRVEDYFVTVTAITSSGLHSTTSQLIAGVPLGV